MATIPSSEILAELAKHPYKQTDKVQIGGSDHYVKVFVLGTQTPKIIEDSGNPSSIAQACDDILCVGKKGIVVDNTTCYVLKETTPCGTFKRAVVFESSTNAQIVGVVDNDSVTLSTQQGGGIKVASTLPNGGDFVGQICVLTTGSTYVWTGSQWSSTAGTATLPTATSANANNLLISTGSAWVATNKFPLSTGPNQMLVSDGNGGWKVGAVQALENNSSPQHVVGKYCYKKIATHLTTTGHIRGQLTCRYTLGLHNTCSVSGDIKLESIASTQIAMVSITEVPSAQLNQSGSLGFKYLSEIFDVKFYADYTENAVYIAWSPKSTLSYGLDNEVKLTLDSIIADLDWTFATSTAWDGLDTDIPSSWVEITKKSFMVPPAPTTADNGKVLTVVSGVPTWVSPT